MTLELEKKPEFNHYAIKSMIFGIILLFLIPLITFLMILNAYGDISLIVIFVVITVGFWAILGIQFGKKGLKSEKVVMSIFGLTVSGIVLLSLIVYVIWLIFFFEPLEY